MLNAIRHHIEQAASKAGVRWHRDCTSEMQAEDLALERTLQDHAERLRHLEGVFEGQSDRIDTIIGKHVIARHKELVERLDDLTRRHNELQAAVTYAQECIDQPDWRQRR